METNAKRMIQFFSITVNYCRPCDEESQIVSIFLKIYHGYVIISSFIETLRLNNEIYRELSVIRK